MNEPNTHKGLIPCPRHDGWTEARQVGFLSTLHRTRNVSRAAATVGMSRESAYRFRARPSGAAFGAAWERVLRDKAGHTERHERHTSLRPPRPISLDEVHERHDGRKTARQHQHPQLPRLSAARRAQLRTLISKAVRE